LLSSKIGGPSVHPPAPSFLFSPPASYGPKVWKEEGGTERYRRALYTFRFRSVPYPALQAFDVPNADFACVRRVRSNTPLQALTALNEPVFMDCARGLAWQTLTESGKNNGEMLNYAFRRCVARLPNKREKDILLGLLNRELERFAKGEADAWDLAGFDSEHPPVLPEGVSVARVAAWTAVARVMLNLDETITRE
jgi:hypothetical protein